MTRTHTTLLALSVLALALVAPTGAEVFTVSLTNDTEFRTRYQPLQDPRHEGKLMILTEFGNWIALEKSTVAGVTSDTESRGFGTVLDTNTIVIGWAPNDAPVATDANADPTTRLLNYLENRADQRQDFSVTQFVTTENAGQGGLPAAGAASSGNTSFPVGFGGPVASEPSVSDQ